MYFARPIALGLMLLGAIPVLTGAYADPQATPEVSAAVSRSLGYLEKGAIAWKDKMGCASCHHVPMMLWACQTAKKQGYEVDENAVETARSYLMQEGNAAGVLPPENPPPDRDGTQIGAIYALLALEAGPPGWEDAEVVKRSREHFTRTQNADGTWPPFPSTGRPPILEGGGVSARMLTLALAGLPGSSEDPLIGPAVQQARAALAQPLENPSQQLRALQLMVDLQAGAPQASIDAQTAALIALQRPDGSWAQTPDMPGDAYATGQALYALGKAGKRQTDPEVARAVDFLLETQNPDGSWPMTSRPMPTGGEGGQNLEPITAAATAWAVLGLLAVS